MVGRCQLLSSFGHSYRQEDGILLGCLSAPYLKSARECAHSDDGYLDSFVVSRGENRMDPADRLNGSSMAWFMLIILAGYRLQCLRPRTRRDVTSLGRYLKPKLERWVQAPTCLAECGAKSTADHHGG